MNDLQGHLLGRYQVLVVIGCEYDSRGKVLDATLQVLVERQ
jgi:hypothetical protein